MSKLVGKILFKTRRNRDMSQGDIASILKIKEQQYSAWERGERPIPEMHLKRLCGVMLINSEEIKKLMEVEKCVKNLSSRLN